MTQSGHKELTLSRSEAICLQADIAVLLLDIIELQKAVIDGNNQQIDIGGGQF
jgi:hypothetical protein